MRKSDGVRVPRYRCRRCKCSFSAATLDVCVHQNKRQVNDPVRDLLCSNVSQRRIAKIIKIDRKTVVRKLLFLATQAEQRLEAINSSTAKPDKVMFDDLITIEHTKCKPLAVTVIVQDKTRRILGLEVAKIPASGKLAAVARTKYGHRKDERRASRARLFTRLQATVAERAVIKTDQEPHYPACVQKFFPNCEHRTYAGAKSAVVGQGELKRKVHDPLFSINHTLAMLRANINRLNRRTWCTTKRPDRLRAHLLVYAVYHNDELLKKPVN
ncbi:MAG: transposase [Bdellovibrionaceae bacterium]|nr:transposase [Pseudobdellovibrionaceae bacterium]